MKGITVGNRVFVNYYFEVKYGQGVKANKYFEEIKTEALKLGISDVQMGLVEIGTNSLSTYVSLIFESADAFGRQWGGGSEYAVKSADWKALFKRINEEPTQIFQRKGSDLIYELQKITRPLIEIRQKAEVSEYEKRETCSIGWAFY